MGLSDRERRVCDVIAKGKRALLEDLRLHVGLPTGGRNTAALDETRERLTARAKRLGATVEIVAGEPKPGWLYGQTPGAAPLPTAVCRRSSGVPGSEILIAGHLDTVHDPQSAFRELTLSADGQTATGPGCVDMKGGLVIALAALEAMDEAGVRTPWTLLLNSDEETGSYHSERAIFAESERVARCGGVGIALEPAMADGGLVIERAGSGQFMIDVRGRSAHVGRDFGSGVSAVTALARLILRVQEMSDLSAGVIVNIGPVQGGTATNVVPDLARAWGNVRYPTARAAAEVEARLKEIAAGPDVPKGAQASVQASFIRAAKPLTPGTQALAERARRASEDVGLPLPFGKTAGVCDGNIMQAAGLATIDTLGVRGGGLHTPEEWVELSTLVQRCQLLAVMVMRAAAGA